MLIYSARRVIPGVLALSFLIFSLKIFRKDSFSPFGSKGNLKEDHASTLSGNESFMSQQSREPVILPLQLKVFTVLTIQKVRKILNNFKLLQFHACYYTPSLLLLIWPCILRSPSRTSPIFSGMNNPCRDKNLLTILK